MRIRADDSQGTTVTVTRDLLLLLSVVFVSLNSASTWGEEIYLGPRLGISLQTLQTALEKVDGPVAFAPRPGSQLGTQEARLGGDAGVVQAGGRKENLSTVVLWLPVDAHGYLTATKGRAYLSAFAAVFTRDEDRVVRWIDQMLARAAAEPHDPTYLEPQLFSGYQLKAVLRRSLSPSMLSLSVTSDGGDGSGGS